MRIIMFCALTYFAFGQDSAEVGANPRAQAGTYTPILHFDSKRDATADIQAAVSEAQKTGKRILLDVGGDWCTYCQQMDQFFQTRPEIRRLRDSNFITVPIFYSSEDKNEMVLKHYPKVEGIPHFFVLEKDGTLLRSQHVLELRSNGQYDPEKIRAFLIKWSSSTSAQRTN